MKKSLSFVCAICISLSYASAFAEETEMTLYEENEIRYLSAGTNSLYGNYPGAESYELSKTPVKTVSQTAVGASPAENVFYVPNNEGNTRRSFVLLDKDEEGNYFVITEEEYGSREFSSLLKSSITKDTPDSDWYFDPENQTSIAYWLNTSLYENGAGGKKLPDAVKDNILESEWYIENDVPSILGSLKNVPEVQEWSQNRSGVRKVKSKLALISYTEYLAYQDKISAEAFRGNDPGSGFMTRTAFAKAAMPRVTYSMNFLHVCGSNNQTTVSCNVDGVLEKEYYIRPVFWLDKDFFKTEKIDLEKSGTNVLNEVRDNLYADLTYVYSDEELEKIGIYKDKLPSAEETIATGLKAPGAELGAVYKYSSGENKPEGTSLFEQYVSAEADGEFTFYKRTEGTDRISEDLTGKYVKLAVIPSDKDGAKGARSWSGVFRVESSSLLVVSECSVSGDETVSAEIKLVNSAAAAVPCIITMAWFDKDNKPKSVSQNEISAESGENAYSASVTLSDKADGDVLRIMVKADGKPIFYREVK